MTNKGIKESQMPISLKILRRVL